MEVIPNQILYSVIGHVTARRIDWQETLLLQFQNLLEAADFLVGSLALSFGK
jgi:hypothetical protein